MPSPPPPTTCIPSVRSSPSQESPEAGGGREPGCRSVETPAPSPSLPLPSPSSYVRTSHSCRTSEPPDWVHLVAGLVLPPTLAPALLAPCPAPSLSFAAPIPFLRYVYLWRVHPRTRAEQPTRWRGAWPPGADNLARDGVRPAAVRRRAGTVMHKPGCRVATEST